MMLILFAFIFVLVLAFSSNKWKTRVRRIDPETNKETIEIHETTGSTPGQTAARGCLSGCLTVIVLGILIIAMALSH